ncbi:membrane protein [Rhodobacter aestuarii]|uniref:Membrane protein n=1 Tax=Rhodobacter aestuarii TaxID=453582 RepID=A0A1N7LIG1_9RHOB|nr:YihY/virulence factor BrkB family protein [Rhodobacter aestuarii]PTV95237.1 membrane protein [Rhodobacter aestuarii]SIS73541.1 membrane protein [Rhodobacter aestuarii]
MRFLIGLMQRLSQTNIFLISAGVAFYAMLAVFPGLTATISIWSTVADPIVIRDYLGVADNFIPPEAYAILDAQVSGLVNGPRDAVGWGTVISILFALWSARAGVDALIKGLNLIHGSETRTTFFGLVFGYFMTVALVGVMLAAMATIVAVPVIVNYLPFHATMNWLLTWFPWLAMVGLMLSVLGVLYRFAPYKPVRRDPFFSWGAVVATFLWGAASLGLTYYLANFGSYNKVYGSLGAVIALLMWLYLGAFSVLFGAALNAEQAERVKAEA